MLNSSSAAEHGDVTPSVLRAFLADSRHERGNPQRTGQTLRALIDAQLDNLPLPGGGATLNRWQALAEIAGFDLSLIKLYEGHTDALAILAELGTSRIEPNSAWAVWAAEPPDARLQTISDEDSEWILLRGTKAWCSGAASVTHALVTAWNDRDEAVLAAVDMRQPGIRITQGGWSAVGMRASASVDVSFEDVPARRLGAPRAYLDRPGFWHGGAGIAACWYGAAAKIGEFVLRDARRRADPHKLAHLGAIDATLRATAALLHETASIIDRAPLAGAMLPAMRARLGAEHAAVTVMEHAGRALGAAPLCRDDHFAHLMADLPVFIRQSHAERDAASFAQRLIEEEGISWPL
ncbi:Acyl-CoA dehydrogenase/oxidase domain protein [Candidatus Burkholderia verschuerenii]|uniref:Acyl-CoA dehydrogenase/oxidase domain protein n=1 Tax=Candidatus Burkholderia verschuerenii TaxID=242163 RepID=A0A0L0M6G6_9BURK|nr:acyl-CoA dehydrogenase family protein [Candidatus Burkholderia verschuerenii]KND57881.1 Acyl-CoA dehydrogenase/oxidase domain protein [Candidatus Burkholderia verschuerenii]